jgi:3-phosphoinositide dependent protein kinase-1
VIGNRKLHEQNVENGLSETACSFSMTQFYVAELVEALEYIHSKHIVHRDLKPDNLLLSAEGHLKVTDFGTAKDDEDPESQKTAFCGTVSYLSPEVLNDKPATKASDLWALGCIIFQMLTGRPPLVAENDYLTFQLVLGRHLSYI